MISPEMELLRRRKISQTMKGRMPANLALLHSLTYTDERRKKVSIGRTGKLHTEATKRRISLAKRKSTTPLYRAVRECYKSEEWRKSVFGRDYYTCVLCGKKGGKLNADHFPKRFVDVMRDNQIDTVEKAMDCKELWDIKNGRTLCFKCHSQTETWGNKYSKQEVIKVTA